MIKFGYTILYVKDVQVTVKFYETAFDFKRKFISPGNEYAELLSGETTLAFASHELAITNLSEGYTESKPGGRPFGIEIGITTDDVQGTYDKAVKAGARGLDKATYKAHGQTVAYVSDPDGFLIEICTPMG